MAVQRESNEAFSRYVLDRSDFFGFLANESSRPKSDGCSCFQSIEYPETAVASLNPSE